MSSHLPASIALALVALAAFAGPTAAQSRPATVVELFTSQGCSSCPPANANLITLSQRPDVLTLSYAVTYWDRLGWKDIFSKPEFTDRQVVYEPALDQFGPYTPQMVINGASTAVGNHLDQVETLIATTPRLGGPELTLADNRLRLGAGTAPDAGADIWQVSYDPTTVEVEVPRGENAGRTLAHTHVVHDLVHLGRWTGAAQETTLTPPPEGLRTAILLQQVNGGPILAAVTD
ncbi:DUF1223 domain-containing protein [Devosia sp. FKR38]|uniref:DUF1223 domain-containing protein n=1 Tax=Devosia sp. FKR38 TaxID=2562312 RepID=UPI0010C0D972|nr:DUF1223 domain-containing protein [Devosia sp. FKR38]